MKPRTATLGFVLPTDHVLWRLWWPTRAPPNWNACTVCLLQRYEHVMAKTSSAFAQMIFLDPLRTSAASFILLAAAGLAFDVRVASPESGILETVKSLVRDAARLQHGSPQRDRCAGNLSFCALKNLQQQKVGLDGEF